MRSTTVSSGVAVLIGLAATSGLTSSPVSATGRPGAVLDTLILGDPQSEQRPTASVRSCLKSFKAGLANRHAGSSQVNLPWELSDSMSTGGIGIGGSDRPARDMVAIEYVADGPPPPISVSFRWSRSAALSFSMSFLSRLSMCAAVVPGPHQG